MKKIYSFLKLCVVLLGLVAGCFSINACQKKETFKQNTVYLFWQDGCIHCHEALAHIQQKHPNMNIEMLNIAQAEARQKLIQAVKEFNLSNQIGTPLFVMDKEVLIGWSSATRQKFDAKAPLFQKK